LAALVVATRVDEIPPHMRPTVGQIQQAI